MSTDGQTSNDPRPDAESESADSTSDKIEIPDEELKDIMRFTRAATKREAIVTAIAEFNRRRRMAALVEHAGRSESFMTFEQLQAQRRRSRPA